MSLFQSTRPRGARLKATSDTSLWLSFNPRARGGRDYTVLTLTEDVAGFNPRARGGRDTRSRRSQSKLCRFNPRARGGRDFSRLTSLLVTVAFQSTRPRGARPISDD